MRYLDDLLAAMPVDLMAAEPRPVAAGRPLQVPAQMTNGEINREMARLNKVSSAITQEFIACGRGHELFSTTGTKTDDLSMRSRAVSWRMWHLDVEGDLRYGPGYHRGCLPRGGAREPCGS